VRTISIGWFLLNCAAFLHGAGRVHKLEEMSFTDIDSLDRSKTIFFLTFGNLEEHGPHLPVGSDHFQAVAVRNGMVDRLLKDQRGYDIVNFPVVPLGEGGANDMAGKFDHPGTFAVRYETLRNVAIDLGASIARNGFRHIFLIHCHGSLLHNVAFTEAADFISDRYKARMVNITSIVFGEGFYSSKVIEKYLGKGWEEKIGFEGHAGAAETSANLFARGDLVKPEFKRLNPFVVKDLAAFLRTYERTGWNGYWGDPAAASKAMGQELIADFIERSLRFAQRALAGQDMSQLPVYPDNLPTLPDADALTKKILGLQDGQAAEIQSWLRNRAKNQRK
jgi:creatinine amidohydrolase